MCSWCWAFRPALAFVMAGLPQDLAVVRLLGGLAPDSDEPMPDNMREWLQNTWRLIQERVPGTRFNFAFWEQCIPRRSTYPACRAVIASRTQEQGMDEAMTLAIQRAYYLQARNPSDRVILTELADEIGLDACRFTYDLNRPETALTLKGEIAVARRIGARSFPTLIFANGDRYWSVAIDYREPQTMLDIIRRLQRMTKVQ